MLAFAILGPLEVSRHGEVLTLGGGKQRALLAALLLHRNETVSTERLIDELWGENPPPTANKIVQTYVSQLRRSLGEGVLVTRAPGYVLTADPGALDADRFERLLADGKRLLADGRADTASDRLREALSLWRGPALADFRYEQFAQGEIARLEEQRLSALEERIEADLMVGRDADLV